MVGAMGKQFWLMKSEPDTFGIDDLARVKIEPWTGVRSYFARAHMRAMSVGDAVLFHHSNVTPPGVAGLARVVRTLVVDETQFDPRSKYHDPKATRDRPIWDCVEVEYVATLPHFVAMDRVRAEPALADMLLLRRGMRLSVQPVTEAQYEAIVALGQIAPPAGDRPAISPRGTKPTGAAVRAAKTAKTAKTARPSARPAKRTAKAAKSTATRTAKAAKAAPPATTTKRRASAAIARRR
jgi:predicted RNA-binding protein with PUA-like domain